VVLRRRDDLSAPRGRLGLGVHYDPEAFGRFSEAIARYIGTARFLVIQTVVVIVWITLNATVPALRFDRYPFILLTLALSLQAAYAAPLILLAQNRQDQRDRAEAERDRMITARTQADAEFLAREIASVRLALAGMPTADDLSEAVERLTDTIERLAGDRLAGPEPSAAGTAREPTGS
ncbi:MAG TPA: DUF1003 domain-containing protein, partial [Acidimicrobiales bacterium]|jgi:uncharacterized membrane protein|nr:DUF1003 domain-containing protein [Acidimicrobiales bacterium]